MERVDVGLLVTAAVLTTLIFAAIYSVNAYLGGQREDAVSARMAAIVEDFEDVEASGYLIDYLAESNGTCPVLIAELNRLEQRLWELDNRIKHYRAITEDFASDEFYIREKRRLNRREIIHLALLEKVRRRCDYDQAVILFFYNKSVKDDEQGFVLTHLNQRIDPEISIFSFDTARNVSGVTTLLNHYGVNATPCVVVEGEAFCGFQDKASLEAILCDQAPQLSICPRPAAAATPP